MARAHVIGAGLSGLSSALQLLDRGYDVSVYEAAGEAGGRCRSFHDVALDCLIDNGNHLLLSGNTSAMAFLDRLQAGRTAADEAPRSPVRSHPVVAGKLLPQRVRIRFGWGKWSLLAKTRPYEVLTFSIQAPLETSSCFRGRPELNFELRLVEGRLIGLCIAKADAHFALVDATNMQV